MGSNMHEKNLPKLWSVKIETTSSYSLYFIIVKHKINVSLTSYLESFPLAPLKNIQEMSQLGIIPLPLTSIHFGLDIHLTTPITI
jgi:hypothetical protein